MGFYGSLILPRDLGGREAFRPNASGSPLARGAGWQGRDVALYATYTDTSSHRFFPIGRLFRQKQQTLWVLLIESKSGHAGSARRQILNTQPLIKHLLTVVKYQAQKHGTDLPTIEYRGIVLKQNAQRCKTDNAGRVTYAQWSENTPAVPMATLPRQQHLSVDSLCV